LLVVIMLIGVASNAIPAKWFQRFTQRFIELPYWIKIIAFLVVAQLVVQFQSADIQPFLYAQF